MAIRTIPRSTLLRAAVILGVWLATACASRAEAKPGPGGDELWAIRCLTTNHPNRVQILQRYGEAMKQVKGLRGDRIQIHHEEQESTLFYGRYERTFDSKKNQTLYAPDPLPDLQLIRSLEIRNSTLPAGDPNNWPFRFATLAVLPSQKGVRPEWNLENARGCWSLHAAVFYNAGEMRRRKHAAEEYCRLLREQGHEAYYHHGADKSSVCVGLFPESAVQVIESENPLTGAKTYSHRIVDPRLIDLQRKFPQNHENGHAVFEIKRNAAGKVVERTPVPTFVVRVPAPPAPQRVNREGIPRP